MKFALGLSSLIVSLAFTTPALARQIACHTISPPSYVVTVTLELTGGTLTLIDTDSPDGPIITDVSGYVCTPSVDGTAPGANYLCANSSRGPMAGLLIGYDVSKNSGVLREATSMPSDAKPMDCL